MVFWQPKTSSHTSVVQGSASSQNSEFGEDWQPLAESQMSTVHPTPSLHTLLSAVF